MNPFLFCQLAYSGCHYNTNGISFVKSNHLRARVNLFVLEILCGAAKTSKISILTKISYHKKKPRGLLEARTQEKRIIYFSLAALTVNNVGHQRARINLFVLEILWASRNIAIAGNAHHEKSPVHAVIT